MKIFITGVTGFVGCHVVSKLLGKGHQILGLIRPQESIKCHSMAQAESIIESITDLDLLASCVQQCDGVVHAAASNVPYWDTINAQAIDVMLKNLEGTGKPFAMPGGTMVFGDTGKKPLTDNNGTVPFNPPPPLQTRVTLEQKVLASQQMGIRPLILYGSLVYGGDGAMIPAILKKTAEQSGISPYIEDGQNIWASVHIEDWADLFVLALENSQAQGQFFAATANHTLTEIAQAISFHCGFGGKTVSLPFESNQHLWGFFTQPLALMNQAFSGEKALSKLNWQPKKSNILKFI
jgi:nucleoside-diphosphate-sugar epimerase